jgi:mono/diheme cytochrome c family protein
MFATNRSHSGIRFRAIAILTLLAVVATSSAQDTALESIPAITRPVDFAKEVFPVFEKSCQGCHGEAQQMGELRLDTKTIAMRGGAGGPAVIPGHGSASPLLKRIAHVEGVNPMPMGGEKLTNNEIALIRAWIDQGAVWPDGVGRTEAKVERHWAYIRPEGPVPPQAGAGWARNAIDRFVSAKLEGKGLKPNPEASRETLVRRLSLDLTGVPPTEDQVDSFLADQGPGAYERLVDRLLESPRYGEHWASSWLDLARYADTNGYESDEPRTIWLYRDWVINAFNRNLGFDQFTIEQLAGDLLPDPTEGQKIATGFHRNTLITNEAGSKDDEFYDAAVKDRVDTTATVWLASTIGCAQCHDHKFDPFTQREYYSFYAIFNNTTDSAIKLSDELDVFRGDTEELARREAALVRFDEFLNTSTPELEAAQGKWEAEFNKVRGEIEDGWQPLRVISARADGKELTIDSDGSIVIEGEHNVGKVFDIEVEIGAAAANVLRIESASADGLEPTALAEDTDEEEKAKEVQPITIRGVEIEGRGGAVSQRIEAARANLQFDDWHMIGPFREASRRAAFEKRHGPETDYDLLKIYEDGNLFWNKRADWQDGTSHLLQGENAAMYVHRTVSAKEAAPLVISLGSNKGLELWFNQKKIYSEDPTREVRAAQKIIRLDLKKGENHIILKSANDTGDYGYYFRAYTEPEWEARVGLAAAAADTGSDAMLTLPGLVNGEGKRGWDLSEEEGGRAILRTTEPIQGEGARLRLRLLAERAWSATTPARRMPARLRLSAAYLSDFATEELQRTPASIREIAAMPAAERGGDEPNRLAAHYRSIAPSLATLRSEQTEAATALEEFRGRHTSKTLVLQEREDRRETFIQNRGNFLDLTERVQPGTPRILGAISGREKLDRLGLARWLVSGEHPLTARVRVNQIWSSVFGRGFVTSPGDFGTQGERPSHPELLDWLSTEFVRLRWDQKALLKTIVSSAAYRQASTATAEKLEKDPNNGWLSRGARFRVGGEAIRDVALQIGGLLSSKLGGPSVFPPQPDSVLGDHFIEGGFRLWNTSEGEDRYRRAIYTFYKRTVVYPMLSTFDAPDRVVCTARRSRSNTPLQALITLNDPAFFEAAGGLAQLITSQATTPSQRVDYAFRRTLAREPSPQEADSMLQHYEEWAEHYRRSEDRAAATVAAAFHDAPPETNPIELAPWIVVANVMLNLDETMTRE